MPALVSTISLAALLPMAAARADVYGYVDDGGTLHLATERLDDRYALFLKSRDGGATIETVKPAAATETETALDPSLARTRLFKRLVDDPNIARYEPMIRDAAKTRGLDPGLVKAVVAVESGFDPHAVSDKGAVGLMQVLPATGERYGLSADRRGSVDAKLADPKLNLAIGTRYLSDLIAMFPDRLDLALAAYNAGENAVSRRGNAIPPFPETQAYVKLVGQFHAFYRPPVASVPTSTSVPARIRATIPARRNLPDADSIRLPVSLPASDAVVRDSADRADRADR